jgi:3-hydroxyacyl-CoA dehydrogenase
MDETGLAPEAIDTCMTLGTGQPMGPLALLDFVGMDVSKAIGDALHAESNEPTHDPPPIIVKMVEEGKLGRKSGAGFYSYD